MSCLNSLPDELVVGVLAYLPLEDLMQVRAVSRRFRAVASDSLLWRRVRIVAIDATRYPDGWRAVAEQCCRAQTQHLSFEAHDLTPATLEPFLSESLRTLDVRRCQAITDEALFLIGAHCPQLDELNLEWTNVSDPDALLLVPPLRRLTLRNCDELKHGRRLCENLIRHHAARLTHLDLMCVTRYDEISDDDVVQLVGACTGLRGLMLDGDGLTDVSLCAIASLLPQLTDLRVSFCSEFSNAGINTLAQQSEQQLRRLQLRKCTLLNSLSLSRLLYANASVGALRYLDLAECELFDDEGCEAIAFACPQLTCCILSWCTEVTDKGLGVVVTRCAALDHIDVTGLKRISDASISLTVVHLKCLRFLSCQSCNAVTNAALERVAAHFEGSTVIEYYGEDVLCGTLSYLGRVYWDFDEEEYKK